MPEDSSLQRAKNSNENNEPQLVERNGVEVYRVKKKKRRSSQKKDEAKAQASRRLFKFLAVTVGLIVTIVIVGVILLQRVNSKNFEKQVQASLAESFLGEVNFSGLSIGPYSAQIASLKLAEVNGGLLNDASFDNVSIVHHGFGLLGMKWSGQEVSAEFGSLNIDLEGSSPVANSSGVKMSFDSYRCDTANVTISEKGATWLLEGAEVIYSPDKFELYQAKGSIFDLGNGTIEELRVETGNEKSAIMVYTLNGNEKKHTLEGSFIDRKIDLSGKVTDLKIETVIPELGEFMRGVGDCDSLKVQGNLSQLDLECVWKDTEFSLSIPGISLLLNKVTGERENALLNFKGSVKYNRTVSGGSLSEIDLTTIQDIKLKGKIEQTGSSWLGNLELGIPEVYKSRLKDLTNSPSMVSENEGGLLWLPIEIKIRNGKVSDDLFKKLKTSESKELDKSEKKELEKQLESLLNP